MSQNQEKNTVCKYTKLTIFNAGFLGATLTPICFLFTKEFFFSSILAGFVTLLSIEAARELVIFIQSKMDKQHNG